MEVRDGVPGADGRAVGFHRASTPAPRPGRGGPEPTTGKTLNGILYVLVTGCRRMDIPKQYGSYKTAWRRLKGGGPGRVGDVVEAPSGWRIPGRSAAGASGPASPRIPAIAGGAGGAGRIALTRRRIGSCEGVVERFFVWRKGGFRRWMVRHERLPATFRAFVYLACFLLTWRVLR